MMKGTIKTLIRDKGFGFIAREGESKDLFFHREQVTGMTFEELKEGDTVSFDVVEGQDKMGNPRSSASNVTRA